jgi:hypothetical protein
MQQVPVRTFTYNKETQNLSACESDLRGVFDMDRALRYETFEIVGDRETKRYCFYDVQREKARYEIGDIQAWLFRPVDGFGRAADGPRLIIFND